MSAHFLTMEQNQQTPWSRVLQNLRVDQLIK